MVEFAIMFPVLLLLCLGAVDFGRIFYHAVTVAHAAGTGALFGATDNITAGDYDGIEQRVDEDTEDIPAVTTTPSQFCGCPDGTEIACADILLSTCSGYGRPRAYIRVQTTQTFDTLVDYPGIPAEAEVSRRAWMRVQ